MCFGPSRGLLVTNCQSAAETCYIPPTWDSNRPGEIREWWNPIWRSRPLSGPRGRNRPGGGSRGGRAAQSRSGGGGGSPSPLATVRPRTRVRVWRAACAACQTDAYAYARPRRRLGVDVRARRPGVGWRASGSRPVGVRVRCAARAGVTVVGAEWRLLRRGLATPATRRKPGRRSVLPRVGGGYVPWDRSPPRHERCAARAGLPSSVPGGAYLVGVWLRRRQGKSRDAGPGLSARGHPVSSCSCTGWGPPALLEWGCSTARWQTARLQIRWVWVCVGGGGAPCPAAGLKGGKSARAARTVATRKGGKGDKGGKPGGSAQGRQWRQDRRRGLRARWRRWPARQLSAAAARAARPATLVVYLAARAGCRAARR